MGKQLHIIKVLLIIIIIIIISIIIIALRLHILQLIFKIKTL